MTETEQRQREQEVLAKVAQALTDRRLTAAAILFLESVKPLSFLASQALVFLGPMAETLLPPAEYRNLTRAIESREEPGVVDPELEEARQRRVRGRQGILWTG